MFFSNLAKQLAIFGILSIFAKILMMKRFLILLLLFIIGLAILPFFLPKQIDIHIERTMNHQVSKVYDQFYDLQKFNAFDAWTGQDSIVRLDYSEPSVGIGSSYTWSSTDPDIGTGSMYIKNAEYSDFVEYDVNFSDKLNNTSRVDFTSIDNSTTKINWVFKTAEVSYPYQYFNLFMKGTIKDRLEESLNRLEVILNEKEEIPLQLNTGADQILVEGNEDLTIVGIQQETTSQDEFEEARAEGIGFVRSFLADGMGVSKDELQFPVVYYLPESTSNKQIFITGYFVDSSNANIEEGIVSKDIPAGQHIKGLHNGGIKMLKQSQNRMKKFAAVKKFKLRNDYWEIYPKGFKNEENGVVEIYYPLN